MKLIFMNKYLHLVSGVMPGSEGSIDIIHKASAARSFGELAVLEFCHVILQSQQVRRHVLFAPKCYVKPEQTGSASFC